MKLIVPILFLSICYCSQSHKLPVIETKDINNLKSLNLGNSVDNDSDNNIYYDSININSNILKVNKPSDDNKVKENNHLDNNYKTNVNVTESTNNVTHPVGSSAVKKEENADNEINLVDLIDTEVVNGDKLGGTNPTASSIISNTTNDTNIEGGTKNVLETISSVTKKTKSDISTSFKNNNINENTKNKTYIPNVESSSVKNNTLGNFDVHETANSDINKETELYFDNGSFEYVDEKISSTISNATNDDTNINNIHTVKITDKIKNFFHLSLFYMIASILVVAIAVGIIFCFVFRKKTNLNKITSSQ